MLRQALFAISAVAVFSLGCNDVRFAAPNPMPGAEEAARFASSDVPKLDLLFVVDNSGSMETEHRRLKDSFRYMMEAFEKGAGSKADLHIAVASTDVGAGSEYMGKDSCGDREFGDLGRFHTGTGCGLPEGARFLVTGADGQKNHAGSLTDAFACMANLGTKGCGYEQHLLSMVLALDGKTNPGFLRDDALLGIVFVTDEDDCSAPPETGLFSDSSFATHEPSFRCAVKGHSCNGQPVAARTGAFSLESCVATSDSGGALYPVTNFVEALLRMKPRHPERVFVSAIAGWPTDSTSATYRVSLHAQGLGLDPVCVQGADDAYVGLRLKAFVDAFGKNGRIETICREDFRPALETIGAQLGGIAKSRCLKENVLDVEPERAGLQPNCLVTEVSPGPTGPVSRIVLPCEEQPSQELCWRFIDAATDGVRCDGPGAIEINRSQPPAPESQLAVRCEACAKADDPRCSTAVPEPAR